MEKLHLRVGGTNRALALSREARGQMRGMGQRRKRTLVGRGPSCGVATASCSASGQPSQLGTALVHQFVLLCCWRAPHVAQPRQRGRQLCPGFLPIPVFLDASFPAQHHLLSQGDVVMIGGAMLGTDHRLNLGGIDVPLKRPQVTTLRIPPNSHPLCVAALFSFLFLTIIQTSKPMVRCWGERGVLGL